MSAAKGIPGEIFPIEMLPNWYVLNSARKHYDKFQKINQKHLESNLDLKISLVVQLKLFAEYYGKSIASLIIVGLAILGNIIYFLISHNKENTQITFFFIILYIFYASASSFMGVIDFYFSLKKIVMNLDTAEILNI